MKKKLYLLSVVLVLFLGSCAQQGTLNDVSGMSAKLEIQLGVASKTIGAIPIESQDNSISSVTVGVFNGDRVDVISTNTPVSGKITVVASAGNRTFIAVANAPTGSFAGIQTKTAFLEKSLDLTQDKTSMLMASDEIPVTLVSGDVPVQKSISITRLAARVQITSIQTDFSLTGQYSGASFAMDKIFMYNAKSKTTVGTIPVTGNLVHGVLADGTESLTSLLDKLNTAISFPTTAYTTPSYFYVYENSVAASGNDENATKIVIGGTFKANSSDAGTYLYYPIVVNKPQIGTTIVDKDGAASTVVGLKRNQQYFITVKIKGVGVDSPAKFINPANLDLNITVTPWSSGVFQDVSI